MNGQGDMSTSGNLETTSRLSVWSRGIGSLLNNCTAHIKHKQSFKSPGEINDGFPIRNCIRKKRQFGWGQMIPQAVLSQIFFIDCISRCKCVADCTERARYPYPDFFHRAQVCVLF